MRFGETYRPEGIVTGSWPEAGSTEPRLPEAGWIESRHHSEFSGLGKEAVFRLGGRDVADGFEQPAVGEPVDPFECGELGDFEAAPRPAAAYDLGLEESDHRLSERVVIAVADATDRRLDPGLSEALGVLDRDILRAAVAVLDQAGVNPGDKLGHGIGQVV